MTQQGLGHKCELTPHHPDSLSHFTFWCLSAWCSSEALNAWCSSDAPCTWCSKEGWNLSLPSSISCCGYKLLDCVLGHYVWKHYFLKDCGEMGKVTHCFPLLGKACVCKYTSTSDSSCVYTILYWVEWTLQTGEAQSGVKVTPERKMLFSREAE